MLVKSVSELIGSTPLLELGNLEKELGLKARLLAKLEFMNPAGSAKDRVALSMIEAAEKSGKLQPGGTIIEETSGNTGIGLASVGCPRGYRVVIVMPDSMSAERIRTMKAYGAEVILTPGALGMQGALEEAEKLSRQIPGSIIAGQFVNPANPEAHYHTTGPEIWKDTCGEVDAFVVGVGTGGTITGTGRYLKEQNPSVKIIAVEPESSPLLSKGVSGPHDLQGIGANFVPEVLDTSVYDEIITVADEAAYEAARLVCRKEGTFVGITSGAALCAAVEIAKREEFTGKTVVVLFTDTGTRYLSTKVFEGM